MSKAAKRGLIIALSFMVCFCCVGYAALTDTLAITGDVVVTGPKDDVIIQSIVLEQSTATSESNTYFFPTNVRSTVTFGNTSQSVTYKITVVNRSTSIKYSYSNMDYDTTATDYNGNASIGSGLTVSVTADAAGNTPLSHENGAVAANGGTLTFYVTYKVSASNLLNTPVKTLINCKFGVHSESAGEAAVNNATDRFSHILNDEILYDKLIDAVTNESTSGKYIGNVAGSDSGDSAVINELFTNEAGENLLTLVATDGTKKEVTCLIKEQQLTVAGQQRTTMTIYMTPDEISGSLFRPGSPDVYAIGFYLDETSNEWLQLGDMYFGTAPTNNYEAEWFGTHNSFNTDEWETQGQTYTVYDTFKYGGVEYSGYTYTINAGQGIETVLSISNVTNELAKIRELYDLAMTINLDSFSGSAVEPLRAAREAAGIYLAEGGTQYQCEAVVVLRDLANALKPFADKN